MTSAIVLQVALSSLPIWWWGCAAPSTRAPIVALACHLYRWHQVAWRHRPRRSHRLAPTAWPWGQVEGVGVTCVLSKPSRDMTCCSSYKTYWTPTATPAVAPCPPHPPAVAAQPHLTPAARGATRNRASQGDRATRLSPTEQGETNLRWSSRLKRKRPTKPSQSRLLCSTETFMCVYVGGCVGVCVSMDVVRIRWHCLNMVV